jgi:hypothetical protein
MVDWLNANEGATMAILTAVYVIATVVICIFNYKSAKATKEQTDEIHRQFDEENRPYVTMSLIYERKSFYGLRFTNHGKRIATQVKISLSQDFIDSLSEPNYKELLEKQAGRECIIDIDHHYDLFFSSNEIRKNTNKRLLTGRVDYLSDDNKPYFLPFQIDLDAYATFFSVNSHEDDVLKQMREQTEAINMIVKRL